MAGAWCLASIVGDAIISQNFFFELYPKTSESTESENKETSNVLFKKLRHRGLQGQPLLPFVLHDTEFEFTLLQQGSDSGSRRSNTKCNLAYWESSSSIPLPASVFDKRSLRTVQRLVLKQWAPRAIRCSDLLNDCLANRRFLSTGFPQLDSFLGGGLITGEIVEIFGASGVGKTQLCHSATMATVTSSVLPELEEAFPESLMEIRGPTVLYLDTKGDFDAKRLRDFIRSNLRRTCQFGDEALNLFTNQCLTRVWHRLAPALQDLMDAIVEMRLCVASALMQTASPSNSVQLTSEEEKFYSSLRLVVIDCLTGPFIPFSSAFPVESTLYLQVLSTEMRRLSSDFHIAVLVSNNCRYGVEASRGCLGEFWSTVPRLTLHIQPLEIPLRASVEITRQSRCTNGEYSGSDYIGSFLVTGSAHFERADIVRQKLEAARGYTQSKPILLVVSLHGIKVCDATGTNVHMAHALRRISYATCDPDCCQFAFLAREPKAQPNVQYCHAFVTKTSEEAESLNNLVGEAFRIAYAQQRALLDLRRAAAQTQASNPPADEIGNDDTSAPPITQQHKHQSNLPKPSLPPPPPPHPLTSNKYTPEVDSGITTTDTTSFQLQKINVGCGYMAADSGLSSSEFAPRAVKPHALGEDSDDENKNLDNATGDDENYNGRNAANFRKSRSDQASKEAPTIPDKPTKHYRTNVRDATAVEK
ncbi:hypothetical protein Aperf_G00000042032 [Anoplocephala perfoliata]